MSRSLWNQTKERLLVENLEIAMTPWGRLRGLLGREKLEENQGLLLEDCWSIHTCFLKFSIDVIFLGEDMRVQKVVPELRPWKLASSWGATYVLELPAGTTCRQTVEVQDVLLVQKGPQGIPSRKAD